ncbi:hypothetical protein E2562_013767 [Oryza meyeriana var. granulata]|uniref:Uncharacterized protein n=1 Tax=Oryza meyeriana var. granulata TaxID=110450 RepID=A0A6G1F7V3_9ORYZ|nr:hypothetical protein E2562_013767 [Oryza meyeriana var. granulata]
MMTLAVCPLDAMELLMEVAVHIEGPIPWLWGTWGLALSVKTMVLTCSTPQAATEDFQPAI